MSSTCFVRTHYHSAFLIKVYGHISWLTKHPPFTGQHETPPTRLPVGSLTSPPLPDNSLIPPPPLPGKRHPPPPHYPTTASSHPPSQQQPHPAPTPAPPTADLECPIPLCCVHHGDSLGIDHPDVGSSGLDIALWTLCARSTQPLVNTGEPKKMAAPQGRQTVLTRICPWLEADGTRLTLTMWQKGTGVSHTRG